MIEGLASFPTPPLDDDVLMHMLEKRYMHIHICVLTHMKTYKKVEKEKSKNLPL